MQGKTTAWPVLLLATSLLPLFPGETVSFPLGLLELNLLANPGMFAAHSRLAGCLLLLVAFAQAAFLACPFVRPPKARRVCIGVAAGVFLSAYVALNFSRSMAWHSADIFYSVLSCLPFLCTSLILLFKETSRQRKSDKPGM